MIVAAKTWQRSAPLPLVHGLHDPAALPRLHPWLAPGKNVEICDLSIFVYCLIQVDVTCFSRLYCFRHT